MLNGWFVRVVLILWLVSALFAVYLLLRVDWIVHNQLYDFGLQFSHDWALGYWAVVRGIFVFLAVPIVLSIAYFGLEFWRFARGREVAVRRKPVPFASKRVEATQQNHVLINCPKCKRVFTKPLVMLDFSGGETSLVNVCPYCNHVLGSAEECESEKDVGVLDFEEGRVRGK